MKKFVRASSAVLMFTLAAMAWEVEPAEAGLFGRLFGRRPGPAQACGPACRRAEAVAPRRPAPSPSPARSGCYTLPGGVRVCPVR